MTIEKDDPLGTEEIAHVEDEGAPGVGVVAAVTGVANSKPFNALLGPSFQILGEYWGRRTEEKVREWDEKRRSNLISHTQRVFSVEGPARVGHTEKREELQRKWAENSEYIDPVTEKELSAVWQGILGRVMAGDIDAEEMISLAKNITAREALYIIRTEPNFRPVDEEIYIVESLFKKGIVRKNKITDSKMLILIPFAIAFVGAFGFYTAATVSDIVTMPDFLLILQDGKINRLVLLITSGLLMTASSFIIWNIMRYNFTYIGWKLKKCATKYLGTVPSDSAAKSEGGREAR